MPVIEIHTKSQFESAMKDAKGKIVVVDFFATWCEPCKRVAPIFSALSDKHAKLAVFLKVDTDQLKEVAQDAGVKALPSFGFFHDGKLLEMQQGGDPVTLEAKISALAAKHNTNAFKGAGYSMVGPSSAAAAPAAAKPAGGLFGGVFGGAPVKSTGANAPTPAAAAAPAGGRRNPWADPNFGLAVKAKGEGAAAAPAAAAGAAKPAAAAAKPAPAAAAAAAAPTPAAAKPAAAAPVAAAPKPVVPAAAAAAPKPAAAAPAAAAAPKPAAAAAAPAAAAPAASSSDAAGAAGRVNPWATKEVKGATTPVPSPVVAAPAAAAASPSPTPAASSAAAAVPATAVVDASVAPAEASAAPAASSSPAPAAAAAAASSAPVANDPALVKNLNPGFLSGLTDMGFSRLRCEKALILTGNKTLDAALNWLMEHERDADIDEPLQMVGSSSSSTPAGVNLDDMDEDERAIYESVQAKKLADRGVAFAGGANANSAPAKVSTLNMTTEEKMEWLATRRAEVKARKELEKIELIKEQEKNRKKTVKGAQAADEFKEEMQRKLADDAIRAKKKEEEEKKKARAATLAKLEEAKERRRIQAQRDQEAIAAQKAAAEAAKAKK